LLHLLVEFVRDVERFVDAFRPVAAAASFQLEQVGVEILDVSGEIEGPRDIVIADVAVGDEADANSWFSSGGASLGTEIPVASGSRTVENRARRGQIYG